MTLHSISDLEFSSGRSYDAALVTCGYERRSSFLARSGLDATNKIAIQHAGDPVLRFNENLALLKHEGWSVQDEDTVIDAVGRIVTIGGSTVAVDISSMPRRFLGRLVEIFAAASRPCTVDWFYAPAVFDESALAASAIQPLIADPVSEFFLGDLRSPLSPVGLILGLGLEPHRAMGLVEFLEPGRVWSLMGESDEPRFAQRALEINRELVDLPTTTLLLYPVRSIATTFSALESLVFATRDSYRLVLAPSGPKVFGLACLLVGAMAAQPRPAVWRVGGFGDSTPMDVSEEGIVIGCRSEWSE
ncbi:hypothetical protein [Nocardioides sp.]|uniref:hypothetical protein n=1 Tax=Nocardioides sp. TaxID=35761 RepID=UPI002615DD29|nr:hypothetical protein [Nocardioides sp.]MDI6909822.1 hypothetical protein [Nocardioides sp.]